MSSPGRELSPAQGSETTEAGNSRSKNLVLKKLTQPQILLREKEMESDIVKAASPSSGVSFPLTPNNPWKGDPLYQRNRKTWFPRTFGMPCD